MSNNTAVDFSQNVKQNVKNNKNNADVNNKHTSSAGSASMYYNRVDLHLQMEAALKKSRKVCQDLDM